MRPQTQEYAAFYNTYVQLVQEDDLLEALHTSLDEIHDMLEQISPDKADYAYAEGKWTIKQLLQHMIDTERVFAYRAVCVARGEKQALPGFDENQYAVAADVSNRSFKDMKEELLAIRRSVYLMYKGFTAAMLLAVGSASGKPISCNALGYIIVGHVRHHFYILRSRYGV